MTVITFSVAPDKNFHGKQRRAISGVVRSRWEGEGGGAAGARSKLVAISWCHDLVNKTIFWIMIPSLQSVAVNQATGEKMPQFVLI